MSNVKFRRVKGRVIPIKMTRNEKVKTGVAVAGGAGIGVYAGVRAGGFEMKAAKAATASTKFRRTAQYLEKHIGKGAGSKEFARAAKESGKAAQFTIKSAHARNVGYILSTGLFTYAANKALSKTKLKNDETAKETAAAASGIAGTAIVHAAVTSKKFGIKSGLKTAAKFSEKLLEIGIKVARKKL